MKRFRFRLARLERVRRVHRKRARATLVQAVAETHEAERLERCARSNLAESLSLELEAGMASDPAWLKRLAAWRQANRGLVHEATGALEQAQRKGAEAAREHADRAREHRVLERLQDRRFRRWQHESEMEEQKFLDEVHLLRLAGRAADEEG